jgi:hypothetical protein
MNNNGGGIQWIKLPQTGSALTDQMDYSSCPEPPHKKGRALYEIGLR